LRAVRASQRERLLRSVIAAVSDLGYSGVTVADIVRRARVSRAAFYAHFADKEECFLAATGEGREIMFARLVAAARAVPSGAPDEEVLRAANRAFLAFLADEPAFARVFYIDMPAAGPQAVGRLEAASRRFADLNRIWHHRARERHPDWPAVPDEAYLALAGGAAELIRSTVRAGPTNCQISRTRSCRCISRSSRLVPGTHPRRRDDDTTGRRTRLRPGAVGAPGPPADDS